MNLCSQLFRHLAKFIVCFVEQEQKEITCRKSLKKNQTYIYHCVCVCEPLEMKIDAQLKRIAAASVEISVHLACFVCIARVLVSFSIYIFHRFSILHRHLVVVVVVAACLKIH